MRIVIIIITILIVIIMTTINIKINLEYDILENNGKLKIVLFHILPIFNSDITIIGEYLNFNKKKGKILKLKLDFNDDKIRFINDVGESVKKKIALTKLHIFALCCFSNPCMSCCIGSSVNIFISILFTNILATTNDVCLQKYVYTGFRQDDLKLKSEVMILFSLYDFLWACIKAIKQKVRRKYEKENKLQQHW